MKTPRIEEIVEEFENLKCINYAMYFGCVDKVCECGEEKCRNRQTVEMAEQEYKIWLRTALTEAHQEGKDEERSRCLRWIGTKSAIFNLFNGNNKNLNVNGQDEYKDLVERIKSGD